MWTKCILSIRHARKHFSAPEPEQVGDVQKTMFLLALPVDNFKALPVAYRELCDPTRWSRLVEQFRFENHRLYQLGRASIFSVTLQAGLSALKTPHCYRWEQRKNVHLYLPWIGHLIDSIQRWYLQGFHNGCFQVGDNEYELPRVLKAYECSCTTFAVCALCSVEVRILDLSASWLRSEMSNI